MQKASRKLGLLLFGLLGLPSQADQARGRLLYGRHSDFWKEVDALEKSDDPVGQINRFFEKNGSREGIILADVAFASDAPDFTHGAFNRSELGLGFHALAGGEAYNRIAPKLRGYALWDVSLDGSLINVPVPGESGWLGLLGTSLGMGRQKVIQGEAADFFHKVPAQNSTLFYSGFDLGIGYLSEFSERMRMSYMLLFLPTFFYSEFDNPAYDYGVKKGSRAYRWRTEYESTVFFQPKKEGGVEVGGQVFSGQQPIPVRLVPRTWDSIHRLEPVPVLGALVGAGLVGRIFNASRSVNFEAYGGFYGGYFGGGAGFDLYFLRLEAGSFGLEQSSGYRVRESRIEYLALGLHHEW